MLFRFCSAIALIVLISAAGITLERRILQLKREQTLQAYRLDGMKERFARLKLRCQELNAPARWTNPVNTAGDVPQKSRRR